MMKNSLTLTLIVMTPMVIALCGSLAGPDVDRPRVDESGAGDRDGDVLVDNCLCALARKTNGWCRDCEVGYLASIRIPSPALFEALDAHGHAIDPDLLRCDACRKAIETDAFCERSRMGFVGRQAYLSKLAYYAARGEVKDRSTLDCVTCRKNAEHHGWCESCGIGMVGQLALANRADLEEARRAVDVLGRELLKLATCETCAVATATGGRCPLCKVSYRRVSGSGSGGGGREK